MNLIRRIGTQRHKFKLEFVMRKLKFSKPLKGKIYVSIKRGDHKMKTENMVEMNSNCECDLMKEIVVFPSITLFYDESQQKYQEKQGEMKILLINSNGDKKLLGIVPFDVAEFANSKGDAFSSSQTQQKLKIKKPLQEISQKLKMEASIEFNVFVKYIGQASQTDKSIKDEKVRGQSPFDKLKTFFFGNQQQEKPKEVGTPPKKSESQLREQRKESKKQMELSRKQMRKEKSKDREAPKFEFSDDEKPKERQIPKRQRISSDFNQSKMGEKDKISKKSIPDNKQLSKKEIVEVEPVDSTRKKKQKKQAKLSPSDKEEQQIDSESQKKNNNKKLDSNKKIINKKSIDEKNQQRVIKNIVEQKQRDTLTEYEQKSNKKSNYNKSEQPENQNQNEVNHQFFFDDPSTFPPHLQPSNKKDKKLSQNNEQINNPQKTKNKNASDPEPEQKKPLASKQHKQKRIQEDQQSESESSSQVEPKNSQTGPSPKRKLKENNIQINSKQLQKERQKKKKQENEVAPIPKNFEKKKQPILAKQNEKAKEDKPKQQAKEVSLNETEMKDLFTSFDQQNPKKQQKLPVTSIKKGVDLESNIFVKEQLQRKSKQLIEMKLKLDKLQEVQKKLKEEEALRQAAQKTINNLKQQNRRLQKDLQKVKLQNDSLRQNENQSGIFRNTTDHFLNNTQQQNLQEQNRRLEREKNEIIVALAKEKEKHGKQIKSLSQELQKEKMKFKELENLSKIDLKKLKDENLKLNGNVQIMKDKNKEKTKQNQTLLKENKALNSEVIELKQKLGALKIKICERLNEANQHGENELMQALTQLCQDM